MQGLLTGRSVRLVPVPEGPLLQASLPLEEGTTSEITGVLLMPAKESGESLNERDREIGVMSLPYTNCLIRNVNIEPP